MQLNEYAKLAARTECDYARARDRMGGLVENADMLVPIRLNHALLGIMNELGELSSGVLKWIYYGTKPLDRPNWKEELGDLMWSVVQACNTLGLDAEEMLEANIRKLKARYPQGFTSAHCAEQNRNPVAEKKALENAS